jgi:hypothetical protein
MTPDNHPALPELPEAVCQGEHPETGALIYGHTADQMRAYALESLRRADGATLGEGQQEEVEDVLRKAMGIARQINNGTKDDFLNLSADLLQLLDEALSPRRGLQMFRTTPTAQRVAAGDAPPYEAFRTACESRVVQKKSGEVHDTRQTASVAAGDEPPRFIAKEAMVPPRGFNVRDRDTWRRQSLTPTPPPTGEAVAWEQKISDSWTGGPFSWEAITREQYDERRNHPHFRDYEFRQLYTHPAAQAKGGVDDAMVERAFTVMRGYDCFFVFDDGSLKDCIYAWLKAALTAPADVGGEP